MVSSSHSAHEHGEGPTFQDLVQSYKASAQWHNLSEGSKTEYKKPLERLSELGAGLDIAKANDVALSRSRSHSDFWVAAIRSCKTTHYAKQRLVIFLKLVYRSHNMGNLVDSVKLPIKERHQKAQAHPLTKELVGAMRDQVKGSLARYANYVALSFYTGMRPAEVRNLKWADVGDKYITVMGAKDREEGTPSRMVLITPEVRECLEVCQSWHHAEWCFVTESRRPFNKDMVCQKVYQIFTAMGISGTLYDARRGLATEMFDRGYTLLEISWQLGHRNTKTTEIYIQKTMEGKALSFKGV